MIRRGSRVSLGPNQGTVLSINWATSGQERVAVVDWDRAGTVPTPWPTRNLTELEED